MTDVPYAGPQAMFDIGDQIAGYRLDSVLGRGGMGIVYEATQLSLNRSIALKVIAPGVSSDSAFRERFRREGPLQARLDHPHIVSVLEAGEWEGHLFLAMRLVRGPSLRELLREGSLDADRTLRILTPVADALDSAHEESLIHRDVKPHNILIGRGDHAFLADFGLTKSAGEQSLTKSGHFVGTLDYIAPEQVQGEDASRASDIYALAAVLYETLTGSPPFARPTDAATLFAHVADPPPRPSEARAELGAQIDDVIAHGLAKLPADRPPTALALLDEAERALRSNAHRTKAATPAPPAPPTLRRKNATTDDLPQPDLSAPPSTGTEDEVVVVARDASAPVDSDGVGLSRQAATRPGATRLPPPALRSENTHPPVPPELPEPADSERPGRRALVAIALAAALAAAAGFAVGIGNAEEDKPATAMRAVTGASLAVSVPASWTKRVPTPSIDGLALDDPVAYGPPGSPAAILLAGVAPDAQGPTLLPRSFRERLAAEPRRDDRVRLADGLEAQRYAAMLPRGAETPTTILVVPTDAGALTIACREGGAGTGFIDACQRAAGTLRLRGARAFALGPDAAYAKRLGRTLERMQQRRRAALSRLRQAKSPDGQGRRAAAVAAIYRAAAASLPTTPVNPLVREHNARIRAALRAQSHRYGDLARAASRSRPKTYRRAGAAITRGDARLRAAVEALRSLGFEP